MFIWQRQQWIVRGIAERLSGERVWFLCGLTLELTPTAEADGVSLVRDDAPSAADQAYDGCRSGSGVERLVRPAGAGAAARAPER